MSASSHPRLRRCRHVHTITQPLLHPVASGWLHTLAARLPARLACGGARCREAGGRARAHLGALGAVLRRRGSEFHEASWQASCCQCSAVPQVCPRPACGTPASAPQPCGPPIRHHALQVTVTTDAAFDLVLHWGVTKQGALALAAWPFERNCCCPHRHPPALLVSPAAQLTQPPLLPPLPGSRDWQRAAKTLWPVGTVALEGGTACETKFESCDEEECDVEVQVRCALASPACWRLIDWHLIQG